MNIKKAIKLVCSLLVSFLLLNIVCFFYYNIPVHSESESNSTDYVWEKNKFYSRGTEGFAWGKTDANGFNNLSVENSVNPDILIMGASHTEAFNVSQTENYPYLLEKYIDSNISDMSVYNIGISGHRITTCFSNFENAIKEFEPGKYVIMEVSTTELTLDEINQVFEGSVKELHSTVNPLLVFLQKIPFFRCVYYQIDKMGLEINFPSFKKDQVESSQEKLVSGKATSVNAVGEDDYNLALNLLMKQIGDIAKENDVKLIIFNHSSLIIDRNGKVMPMKTSEKSIMFAEACRNNGIELMDMHGAFSENYKSTYRLPYGFSNTEVGEGHLNQYGHKVIADELYKLISKIEKSTEVVK